MPGPRCVPCGGLRPHAPSRTSLRCAPLWPTHPPSDFFPVGAQPPRPHSERRAAPPPDRIAPPTPEAGPAPSPLAGEGGGEGERAQPARLLWGLRPHAPSRTSTLRGSGPPTRPRISFLWGRSPHAPARSAGLRRRRIAPSTPAPIDRSIGEHQPPRPHPRPSPDRGQAPAGEPRSPPGTTPPPANKAPRNPKWIVEGGCGGEPPLENTGGAGAARHRGQAPAGKPRSPPGTTPPPAPAAPRNPKWIVEGGVGGSPPLRTQRGVGGAPHIRSTVDGSPLVRYNRRGEDRGRDATGVNPTVSQRVTPHVSGLAPGAALRVAAGSAGQPRKAEAPGRHGRRGQLPASGPAGVPPAQGETPSGACSVQLERRCKHRDEAIRTREARVKEGNRGVARTGSGHKQASTSK